MSDFWYGFRKQALLRPDVELQDQQTRVKKKLDRSGGLLVYHGLGSGKTLTAINATQGGKTDVVVPASLRNNFRKEVSKYTTGYHPEIMSYDKAMKDPERGGKNLVIDEAHNLGHSSSQRSQKIQQLAKNYDKRLLLTGSPIRNHPSELAPLIAAVRGDRAVPTDPKAFSEQYIQEHQHEPGFFAKHFRGVKPGTTYSIKNRDRLAKALDGYVDYHAPSSKDFPSVSHELLETPMDKEQMKFYDFVLDKAGPGIAYKIRNGLPPSKSEATSLNAFLSGVRQISTSTKAFGGTGVSPKIMKAVSELERRHKTDPNFRGLVYSNHLDSGVKSYAEELAKRNITHGIFSGELNDKERKQVVDDYNNGKLSTLLISAAGSEGIDLKGTKLVQLLDSHFHSNRNKQAMGRGIRYKSHAHLPEDQRHVHVQTYHSLVPKTFMQHVLRQNPYLSADQYLDQMSKRKDALNSQFLDVLKEVGQRE